MKKITEYVPTLDSREVAEMVEKNHADLLRDVKRYIRYFNESNFALVEFFQESTYVDSKGEERTCYRITQKGCEFIAHKMTGKKGALFTAEYINRFHGMERLIQDIEIQRLTEEVEELQKLKDQSDELQRVKNENKEYKKKLKYFENAVGSLGWKERIIKKVKRLAELMGTSENKVLSHCYGVIDNITMVDIASYKKVYSLEHSLLNCSTLDVFASFGLTRDTLEFMVDRLTEVYEVKRG